MKSFLAACGIFGAVIGLLIWNASFISYTTDEMIRAVQELPSNTNGDPAEYEIAIQRIHIIWKESREYIAITVPQRITEPLELAMISLEAGWQAGDNAMYRQAAADFLFALRQLQEEEGFSLAAIV